MGTLVKNYDQTRLYGNEVEKYYLTFEALEDGAFKFIFYAADPEEMNNTISEISYSIDNGKTWVTEEYSELKEVTTPTIKKGETVLWKGNGFTNDVDYDPDEYCYFESTCNFNVYGNIMSLVYGDDFFNKNTITNGNTFTWLFTESNVVSAEYLVLPTTLAKYCYANMFNGCTSLTTAPALNAITLAQGCYYDMFSWCTSLTTVPELPALTLDSQSYDSMFNNCSSLSYIKMLATDISESDCLRDWVRLVAPTGTLIINKDYDGTRSALNVPATWTILNEDGTPHIFPRDYSEEYLTIEASKGELNVDITIPYNGVLNSDAIEYFGYSLDNGETWTKIYDINIDDPQKDINIEWELNTGDTILFKGTADYYGYYDDDEDEELFSNFHFLGGQNIKIYGNIMSLFYGDNFVGKTSFTNGSSYNCAGLFTHNDECGNIDCSDLVLPATTLTDYCYSEMFNECLPLTAVPVLPATTLAASCYYYMFFNCTSITTAMKTLPATTLTNSCYSGMFKNCSSLTTAPVLPATALKQSCYGSMFASCSKLNYIKAMFTTTPSNTYTSNWVNGVAATGTFVKNKNATWTTTGNNGVPTGWTVETYPKPLMTLYVDKFPTEEEYGEYWEDAGYATREEYIEAEVAAAGIDSDHWSYDIYEYYGDTLEYDGDTYYVCDGKVDSSVESMQLLLSTDDYNTLLSESIAESGNDTQFSSLVYVFNDGDEYDDNLFSPNRQLLKIINNESQGD